MGWLSVLDLESLRKVLLAVKNGQVCLVLVYCTAIVSLCSWQSDSIVARVRLLFDGWLSEYLFYGSFHSSVSQSSIIVVVQAVSLTHSHDMTCPRNFNGSQPAGQIPSCRHRQITCFLIPVPRTCLNGF